MVTTSKSSKRSRDKPFPNSVLDRQVLLDALDRRGLSVRKVHIDGFYQALHRQHYPSLPEFVEQYYLNESSIGKLNQIQPPLKSHVTSKKNRNRIQLPGIFLDFLRDSPANGLTTLTSRVVSSPTSSDGTTTKLAVELHDGRLVESVLMRYVSSDGSRASLCVSSQCGCAMGCTFCATGTMGLSGNLSAGEILEQIVHADQILALEWHDRQKHKENYFSNSSPDGVVRTWANNQPELYLNFVRNVVFMGMGEPLDNYLNVVEACRELVDVKRWNLAHERVTVSTVGIASKMRQLTKDLPDISLALSLHAPNQELRAKIVPTARNFPIEDLIDAMENHVLAHLRGLSNDDSKTMAMTNRNRYQQQQPLPDSTRRRAMIEYVMLDGVTSTMECAHELGKLCKNRHVVVNLIPYNQTDVKDKLRCPSEEHMNEFRRIVVSHGTYCTIRRTMGADISSACGQLVTKESQLTVPDIEDTVSRPEPKPKKRIEPARSMQPTDTLDAVARKESVVPSRDEGQPWNNNRHLEQWVLPLTIATTLAACCFIISSAFYLKQVRTKQAT